MNVLLLTLAIAAAPTAQPAQSNSWSAWHGCWQAENAPAGEIVCIVPDGAGVRMSTLVDGAVRAESRITADGVTRSISADGCAGSEKARWSRDGERVFLESKVTCPGSPTHNVRGMFVFVTPDEWMSVQSSTSGDSVATRAVRFIEIATTRMPAQAATFAVRRTFDEAVLDIDEADVNEALERVGAEAVHEWMQAAGEPFQLGYQGQRRTSSALAQVGEFSNPVVVREVVRVVEKPVYVNTHVTYHYHPWHYSTWHHHHYGWRWVHRPIVVVRLPIIIYRNDHYRRDYYRHRVRYDRSRDRYRDYDRYRDRDRYIRDHDRDRDRYTRDHDRDRDRGKVTRGGYSSGRNAAPSNRDRSETRMAPPVTRETSARTPRASAPPVRDSNTRTAVPRSDRNRAAPQRSSGTRAAPQRSSSSGTRAAPQRSSSGTRAAPQRSSSGTRAAPQRSNSGSSRGAVKRTARERSSSNR